MPHFSPTPEVQLFYTIQGSESAPPVLLVHGWCANSHDWDFQIAPLADKYRVIAFDLRGHGHSNAPTDQKYRLKDHVSDAVALLHHLGYERDVKVVGHSMGGMITSLLTATHPELFSAFVVVDPNYFTVDAMMAQITGAYDAAGGHVHAVNLQFWPSLCGDIPQWRKTWYTRRVEETPAHVIRGCMEGTLEDHLGVPVEKYQELRKNTKLPRLVVHATEDSIQKEKELGVKELDEVVQIGGVGHWIQHSKADEFNELLLNWLKKVEEAAAK